MTTTPTPDHAVGVEMRDVHKSYGTTKALVEFSMQIEPGEMVVLLGPSGCGKTTALRSLAGLETVTSGQILVGDHDVTNTPVQKRQMAMVFQSYSLFPHLNALENVAFGLRNRGVARAEAKRQAAQALELVGLSDQQAKYTHQMSGGQQQRVALARALAVKPRVMLLDEPLSALDAKVRVQLRDEIRRIQLEVGMTTLFVTHDQEEALTVADRVGVMNQGRIEQIDTPERIYNQPLTPFVASFIGVTNRITAESDGRTATIGHQQLPLLPGSASGTVEVLVRPEAMRLEPVADSGDAQVISTAFLGASSRVLLRLATGNEVVAQVSPSEMGELRPGAGVRIELDHTPALAQQPAR